MKTHRLFVSLLLAPAAWLGAFTPGAVAPVTAALTLHFTAPGVRLVDPATKAVSFVYENSGETTDQNTGDSLTAFSERRSVMTLVRYGNREILERMLLAEQLGGDATIAGWRIVEITFPEYYLPDGMDLDGLYAVKAGREPVRVELALQTVAKAQALSAGYTADFVRDRYKDNPERGSFRELLTVNHAGFTLQGVAVGAYRFATWATRDNDYNFFLNSAVRIANLSGVYTGGNSLITVPEGFEAGVAEGVISLAAQKFTDLETLGFSGLQATAQ